MVARRNWLLRFSILINIAVILYICSHMMIGESNINLVPSYQVVGKFAQQSVQSAMMQQQQPDTPEALKLSSNSDKVNQIVQSNEGATLQQQQSSQYQQQVVPSDDMESNVQHIPRKDSLDMAVDDGGGGEIDGMKDIKESNNIEDSRFDMPTDSSFPPGSYQDINLVNQSINSENAGDSLADLETRLK